MELHIKKMLLYPKIEPGPQKEVDLGFDLAKYMWYHILLCIF